MELKLGFEITFQLYSLIEFQIFGGIVHDANVLPYNMNIRVSRLLFLGDLGRLLFWKGDTVRSSSSVQGVDAKVVITSYEVGFLVTQLFYPRPSLFWAHYKGLNCGLAFLLRNRFWFQSNWKTSGQHHFFVSWISI